MRTNMDRLLFLFVLAVVVISPPAVYAEEDQPLVNLFLFDTDIRDALSEIALQTGVNIIPDQTVGGLITADIQDVPLERALRLVLIGGGYTYRKFDDFYFVGLPDPRSLTFKELAETEIIHLKNTTVGEVTAAMPSFLSSYVQGDPNSNTLAITAPPNELARIKALTEQVDKPQRQVEIQVLITEVSTEASKELGFDLWEYSAQAGQSKNADWKGTLGFGGSVFSLNTDFFGQLLAKLKLLEAQREAAIHADPKVVVASGKEAELFIGNRQIILVQGEETTATRVERLEVGVSLRVLPTVTGNDEVVLEIAPEISQFVDESKSNLVVKESALSTTIRLASGQTALLAGMTVTETVDSDKKVPILGDIPLVRWLFRTETSRDSDRELLIFVTPVIQ